MNKGVIIHLDDQEQILNDSEKYKNEIGLDLNLIKCQTVEQFNLAIEENKQNLRALIFDLLGKDPDNEIQTGKSAFLDNIEKNFARFNIPIFIYSGHLESDAIRDRFNKSGTVFKVDKDHGIAPVYEKLKLFYETGFIDVFAPNGILESQLHKDLHKAFTLQFNSNNNIPDIIKLIQGTVPAEKVSERVKRVFKRIAIRSLLTELISPEVDEDGNVIEEPVSSTEHYVQRINKIDVWTGDIFKHKMSESHILILTPRCNAIRCDDYLVCPFILGNIGIKKTDHVAKFLTGDPTVSGYNRYLPPSPTFQGGKLELSKFFMLNKAQITSDFERVITLSDELTNEVLAKFATYFFRTGITPWSKEEVVMFYKQQKDTI